MGYILIWVVLVLVAVVAAIFLLAIFWQYRMQDNLKAIFAKLRQVGQAAGQKRTESADFSADDPEPYGSLTEKLLRQIDVVDSALKVLLQRYTDLQTSYRTVSLWTWKTLPRFPLDIYNLRKQVIQLEKDAQETTQSLAAVERIRAELDEQGWKIANEARQTLEQDLNVARILGQLQEAGIRDPLLETAIQDARTWEQFLRGQVPAYLMGGDESEVQSQADKHTIAQVYRLVDQARPAVQDLAKDSQAWQQQHSALEDVLGRIPDSFRQLNDKVIALENEPKHPIAWDKTRGPLSGVRLQIERIGDIKKRRTLETMEKDRATADKLVEKIKELSAHTAEVKQEHEEFLKLLEHPDIVKGVEWSHTTQKLATQAGSYHPDNWPSELAVGSLKEELKTLDESHQRLTWDSDGTPVRESELPALLEEAQKLAQMHEGLRPRAASIQARLTQVQTAERETRDGLSRTKALLNQALPLLGANPLLTPGAVKEAEQLRQEVEPLAAELENTAQGVVDKKNQKAQVFIRKADQAGSRWLQILATDLDNKKDGLAKKVERLNSIAFLEEAVLQEATDLVRPGPEGQENAQPVGVQAESQPVNKPAEEKGLMGVFRRRGKEDTQPEGTKRSVEGGSLAEAVSQLKQKNDEWQRSVSLLRALEDIEKPLLERYANAIEQREAACQITAKAVQLIPDEKGWPPTQQTVMVERQQLAQVEKRWEALHQKPSRAIQVVSSLGALSEEYQGLANRIKQIVEHAQQEQTRFVDLEARLEESKHLWNQTSMEQEGNRAAQDDIKEMLAQAEAELGSIRERYGRGSLPYNQAFQALRGLCQKVDSALIPLDAQWEVDINGEKVPRENQ